MILLIFLENFFSIQESSLILWTIGNYIITVPYLISIIIFLVAAITIGYFVYKLNSSKIIEEKEFMKNLEDALNQKEFPSFTADLIMYIKDKPKVNKKAMESILSEILDNSEYISYIVRNNLNFALRLLKIYERFDSEVFWSKIAKELMKDHSSRLYSELNPESGGNKPLTESLFKDYKKAQEILLWKPIGDFVLNHLKDLSRIKEDKNNLYEGRYDLKKLENPIFIGIEFFRRMVHYGLEKNVSDHFWLSYYDSFIDSIIKNYDLEKSTEKDAEFANMYEYYIYEISDNYRGWINKAKDYTVKMENISNDPEANIIKDSIISWTRALKSLLESDRIRYSFKIYIQNIYLEKYFDFAMSDKQKLKDYSKVFVESLKQQIKGYGREINQNMKNSLLISLQSRTSSYTWREKLGIEMKPGGRERIKELIKILNSIN